MATPERERIDKAVKLMLEYGEIDGGHHKMWVIDQALQILLDEDYEAIMTEVSTDEDGTVWEWDRGIAP